MRGSGPGGTTGASHTLKRNAVHARKAFPPDTHIEILYPLAIHNQGGFRGKENRRPERPAEQESFNVFLYSVEPCGQGGWEFARGGPCRCEPSSPGFVRHVSHAVGFY